MYKEVDFVIVGQGIAGTMAAYRLEKAGYDIQIFDEDGPNATIAAAGIINPITGRSFVKSWNFDQLYKEAKDTYQKIGAELEIDVWKELPLYRTIHSIKNENKVASRMQDKEYMSHFDGFHHLPDNQRDLSAFLQNKCVKIRAAKCQLDVLIIALRDKWKSTSQFRAERFDFEQLIKLPDGRVQYHDLRARFVVCCLGAKAIENKIFTSLPIEGYYGQALLLRGLAWPQLMFKNQQFIVPWTDQLTWFGAGNSNEERTVEVAQAVTEKLLNVASNWFGDEVNIEKTVEGTRPTTPDRRPMLGRHWAHPEIIVFNGLGTKGASLAPYLSKMLLNWIEGNSSLQSDIDLKRFAKFF